MNEQSPELGPPPRPERDAAHAGQVAASSDAGAAASRGTGGAGDARSPSWVRRLLALPRWLLVTVVGVALIALAIAGLRLGGASGAAADAETARFERAVARFHSALDALELPSFMDSTAEIERSGLASADFRSLGAPIDLMILTGSCANVVRLEGIAAADAQLPVPSLAPVAGASSAYREAEETADELAPRAAAAQRLDDALQSTLPEAASLCRVLEDAAEPVGAIGRVGDTSELAAEGAAMPVAAGTVTCTSAQGCLANGIPAWDYGILSEDHRGLATAFARGCDGELEAACERASDAFATLADDEQAIAEAWPDALAEDGTAADAAALQAAYDARAEHLERNWARVEEAVAAVGGTTLEAAIADRLGTALTTLETALAPVRDW